MGARFGFDDRRKMKLIFQGQTWDMRFTIALSAYTGQPRCRAVEVAQLQR